MPMRCSTRTPLGPAAAGKPPPLFGFCPPTGIFPNMLAFSCGGGVNGMVFSGLLLDPPGRPGRTIHDFYVQLGKLDADAVGLRPVLGRACLGPSSDQRLDLGLQPVVGRT